jgi:hypothetical protein
MPKKPRKRYSVEASLANVSLARAGSGITLLVFERGRKLGELQVGRGSIFWWGAMKQRRKRLDWRRVAEELNRLAYGST